MIEVRTFDDINAIDSACWDSILTPQDIFNSHAFIKTVADAKVENATCWYLLFFNNNVLVGHAVLSSFTISLDLFIPDNAVVKFIKRVWPTFFHVKILACGLPASFGQLNLKICNHNQADEICSLLHREMENIASQKNISLLCVKEFKDKETDLFDSLKAFDFFKGFSIPYMKLDVKWSSFQDYLENLRHPYRRAIKKSLKKLNVEVPIIYKVGEVLSDNLNLVLGDTSLCSPEKAYKLYLSVMERTPTKLETLNLDFFKELYNNVALELLTIKHHHEIISVAFLIQVEDELTFMLIGRVNDKDEFDSYYNLVYGILQLAIERNIKTINMGQTAYWVKQRIGAQPIQEFIYFKSRKPVINGLLTRLNSILFPEVKMNSIRVFKDTLAIETHKVFNL